VRNFDPALNETADSLRKRLARRWDFSDQAFLPEKIRVGKMRVVKFVSGDTWQMGWQILDANSVPLDLTGASVRLHIRSKSGQLMLDANTTNDKITVNGPNGRIDLNVPYSETNIQAGTYLFDLEVTHSNNVRVTYDKGEWVVLHDMTR